ncbi:head-tail adaptor protein [Novosphingobium sp.]|uniref:phage head completion protein n=1 Tax=Novosphingobium sp. TaxID=1874826 RepID=UPI0038B76AAB
MARTPAGQRNKAVVFERNSGGRSALGGKAQPNWQPLGPARLAKVLYGSGAERRAAAGEQAVQAATVRVLADVLTRSVAVRDRITFDGLAWDITGVALIGGPVASEIEFTATASRD